MFLDHQTGLLGVDLNFNHSSAMVDLVGPTHAVSVGVCIHIGSREAIYESF